MKTLANTTVLSNFAAVDRLDLVQQLHGRLYIPGEVHEEILDFEVPREVGRKLYAVGTGELDEEEEGEGTEEGGPPFEES